MRPNKTASICILGLAVCVLNAAAEKLFVGFEDPAYSVGDNYDKKSQSEDWDIIYTGRLASQGKISNEAAAGGDRSLEISYAPNAKQVIQAAWALNAGKTYYLQYKLKFAEDFEFKGQGGKTGGKLPGLAASSVRSRSDFCSGGEKCPPGEGFTARLMWRENGTGELYLYDVSKNAEGNDFGKSVEFKDKAKFIPGMWHVITERVTVNDRGRDNGLIQVWLDGKKVVNLPNRRIVSAGEKVNTVFFSTFFGGGSIEWMPTTTQTAYFDDFTVSQDPKDVGL